MRSDDDFSMKSKASTTTRTTEPCLLRAPPFPAIDPVIAAVSVLDVPEAGESGPRVSQIAGVVRADPAAVFVAMRAARVGGAFWQPPVSRSGGGPDAADRTACDPWSLVEGDAVVVDDRSDELAVIGWIAGISVIDQDGDRVDPAYLEALAIARIDAAVYRDPFDGRQIDALAAVGILARWRATIDANRGIAAVTGMASWKRDVIARFLWNGGDRVCFLPNDKAVAHARANGGALAYWPSRTSDDAIAAARAAGVPLWQVEDGFVRSDGLGAECRPPYSVLVDRSGGIHYDPARPSDLETILETTTFDNAMLARASTLRDRIVAARIGKYGVDRNDNCPALPHGRRTVLAVGQVGDDLSVRYGGGDIGSNVEFLSRVRAHEPDAYIVYRPHPDVLSGLRVGHVPAAVALALVDRIDDAGSLLPLVEAVDAVHVLSSLTGFEALLRGREVVVHGSPFYTGWGLTTDLAVQPSRRTRRLSLDALVAGALILAPRYLDPVTGLPCRVETLIDRLVAGTPQRTGLLTRFRRVLGTTRRTLALAQDSRA